jgi:hypothetical protein
MEKLNALSVVLRNLNDGVALNHPLTRRQVSINKAAGLSIGILATSGAAQRSRSP